MSSAPASARRDRRSPAGEDRADRVLAIGFIALFLFMPLLTVFSEALAKGWRWRVMR